MINRLIKKIYFSFIKYRKLPKALRKEAVTIALSGMFDKKFYLEHYPDVRLAGIDPLKHFIKHGWKEGRNPSKDFNTSFYLKAYPDVNKSRINPFLHYIQYGKSEGRYSSSVDNKQSLELIKDISDTEYIIEDMYFYANNILLGTSIEPIISIIIPIYGKSEYTLKCLKSISKYQPSRPFEIIVIDDNSPDDSFEILSKVKGINLIKNQTNQGFLLSCNLGAKSAKGEYLYFLNNDTQVLDNSIDALIRTFDDFPGTGLVGSKLIYPDGKLQEAGGIIWNDGTGYNYGRYDDPAKPEYNYVKEVDYISGASIMIKKIFWDEIGGFDTRFAPAYYEESDFSFELRKRSYKVFYQPKSIVFHFERISHGKDYTEKVMGMIEINREKFYQKWTTVLNNEQLPQNSDPFLARDRSKSKKTIVVIDWKVPEYDVDAGSKTTFMYLKLFIDMGLNVKYIPDDFIKTEPYTTILEQMGIEVLYGDSYRYDWRKWIKDNSKYLDYIYLNRPNVAIKYIDFIKENTKAKIFYYGHDLHYLRLLRMNDVRKDDNILNEADYYKKIEHYIFTQADVIYYPSYVEVNKIKETFPEIIVREIVPFIYYSDRDTLSIKQEERKGLLFVGSSHSPNIDGISWFIEKIFPAVLIKLNIVLYIVGIYPDNLKKYRSENIIFTDYVSNAELINYYRKCRMFIAPLRFGAGVKGKIIDAIFHKLPVLTTSIGAEGLRDCNSFLMIEDDERKISEMIVNTYNDFSFLNKLIENSEGYINKNFSKETAMKIIQSDFN